MAKELQVMASQAHLDFLAYLLAMVEQEALRITAPGDPRHAPAQARRGG